MPDSPLVAIDIALLPPPEVSARALELSAALPGAESQGLRLDADHLPHVTLTQQFVRREDLEAALDRVAMALAGRPPLQLVVSGGGRSRSSVWMTIESTPALVGLHAHLMEVLQRFEQSDGTAAAFAGGDARPGDVLWVGGYRLESSFARFTPHITLGHAAAPPAVERIAFVATTIGACHLGRFCTCRRVLRRWTLGTEG